MSIKSIINQKREWNAFKRSVKLLPDDYQFVYKEMQKYIFKTATLNEEQAIELFTEIVKLFEQASYDGKHVLEVTGRDVAGFCDSLTVDYGSYMDAVQVEIEESIKKALKKVK